MADVVGTFDTTKDHNDRNLRKVLRMQVHLAPYEDTTAPASLVNATNQLVVPDGFESVGILDKEAAFTSTPSLTISEVSGYGYGQTLRRDISARNTTIAFTMLESRRKAFEVYYGIDLSSVQATTVASGKNEIVFDEPDRPDTLYWRVLCIGADGDGANTVYIADLYPKCTLTEVGALQSSETEPRRYAVTMGTDIDTTVGTSHRMMWAGPGLSTEEIGFMGFTRAS